MLNNLDIIIIIIWLRWSIKRTSGKIGPCLNKICDLGTEAEVSLFDIVSFLCCSCSRDVKELFQRVLSFVRPGPVQEAGRGHTRQRGCDGHQAGPRGDRVHLCRCLSSQKCGDHCWSLGQQAAGPHRSTAAPGGIIVVPHAASCTDCSCRVISTSSGEIPSSELEFYEFNVLCNIAIATLTQPGVPAMLSNFLTAVGGSFSPHRLTSQDAFEQRFRSHDFMSARFLWDCCGHK